MSKWKVALSRGVAGYDPDPVPALEGTLRLAARRRVAQRVGVAVVALGVFAIAVAGLVSLLRDEPAQPGADPTSRAECEDGPWASKCPEADRVRQVLAEAGYTVDGDNGAALIFRDKTEYLMWAHPTSTSYPLSVALAEGYEHVFSVDGTPVYSDDIGFFWEMDQLRFWVRSNDAELDPVVVESLVRASQRVAAGT